MAWRSSMEFERGVLCEKGAVKKKSVFSSNTCANYEKLKEDCVA
jgi:hypothetical protein